MTLLYDFEPDRFYTLKQTAAPKGYVGMQKNLLFKVNTNGTVSLYEENRTTWGTTDSSDNDWAKSKDGENGIISFIDVYNKPFHFKIVKTDNENTEIRLDNAHFALYKQENTTIGSYVKNKEPMAGFEDMVTHNGEVDVCGGNSGRIINPSENGSVYFLTETKAPLNYTKLEKDIVFRISPIGIPSLVSDAYYGNLVEEDDSYIYTLSVPNVQEGKMFPLTIEKQVSGAFGNKAKEFTFTLAVDSPETDTEYEWAKNGAVQKTAIKSDDTFTMKHHDMVEITLPAGAEVTVTEENEGYATTFQLGTAAPAYGNAITFPFTESTNLIVINTLDGDVATGISATIRTALTLVMIPILPIGMIYYKRRRENAS